MLTTENKMISKRTVKIVMALTLVLIFTIFATQPALANFESSLAGLKSKLVGIILPLLAVIGLVFAAFSFFTGNQMAKQHIFYAIVGCIIGFGAEAIVSFIKQTVN